MRRISIRLALILVLAPFVPAQAQQTIQGLPGASQHATVEQQVGISRIALDYYRPAVNGRAIWGGLVPWDQVWRAGANDNTTITLSDPATIEGKPIAAGTYGLHMIPGQEKWVVALSTNSTSWGSFTYDPAEDAVRVEVIAEASEFDERLRYSFDEVDNRTTRIAMHWENLRVPFTIAFDTPALVVAKIERDLRHLPQFSWQGWNSAAAWTVQSQYALDKGLGWVDRSIALNENGTNLTTKLAILTRLGRNDEVAPIAARVETIGNEVEINALGYTYLLQLSNVDKALELFAKNNRDYPQSWNTYDSLGEAYAAKGNTARARELYTKALEMAPAGQQPRIQGVLDGLE